MAASEAMFLSNFAEHWLMASPILAACSLGSAPACIFSRPAGVLQTLAFACVSAIRSIAALYKGILSTAGTVFAEYGRLLVGGHATDCNLAGAAKCRFMYILVDVV